MSKWSTPIEHEELAEKDCNSLGISSKGREDPDRVLEVLAVYTHEEAITNKEEAALRCKVDWLLMPLALFIYGLAYIDKTIVSLGALFGMVTDLKLFRIVSVHPTVLDTGRYSNVSMIFYTGLILGSAVFSWAGQHYNLRFVTAFVLTAWGGTAMCGAALQDYNGALIQRFFLGFVEGGVAPCLLIYTGMWYKKSEQTLRVGIWFSASGWFPVIAYPVSYGLLHIQGSLAAWRILFIFWGGVTLLFGAVLFLFLPASPVKARFLSRREQYVAIERLRSDQSSVENKHFKREQAVEALLDIKIWLLAFLAFLVSVANGAVSSFSILIIQSLMGSSNFQTILLTIPAGVCSATVTIVCCYFCQRVPNVRCYVGLSSMALVLVCSSLLWKLPKTNAPGLLAALYLMATFTVAFIMVLSLTASNIAGHTKKITATAMVTIFNALGNIAGPLVFQHHDAPRYEKGFLATIICYILAFTVMAVYRILVVAENRKRNAMGEAGRVDHAFHDLTDQQNKSFRYAY